MAYPIVMSSQGMYTADAKLLAWLKAAGSRVEAGEPVAEVETEKTIYDLEAPAAGILHPIVAAGAIVQMEAPIGYVLAEGEAGPPTR